MDKIEKVDCTYHAQRAHFQNQGELHGLLWALMVDETWGDKPGAFLTVEEQGTDWERLVIAHPEGGYVRTRCLITADAAHQVSTELNVAVWGHANPEDAHRVIGQSMRLSA